jgi:hypothetical protein
MIFQKLTLFLGLFFILFVVSSAFGQTNTNENQINQQKKGLIEENTAQDIISEVPESALSPSERIRINAKKQRYDKPIKSAGFNRDLTKLQPGTGIGSGACESPRPSSLPIEQSTAIIVGKVTKAQPYLTESNTAIFTELDFEIEDVLKTNDSSIASRTSIKIDGGAGVLRLAK